MKRCHALVVCLAIAGGANGALAQTGPVATACKDEIVKFCADKPHRNRAVRRCLEANKEKLGAACGQTLESTGRGQGRGKPG